MKSYRTQPLCNTHYFSVPPASCPLPWLQTASTRDRHACSLAEAGPVVLALCLPTGLWKIASRVLTYLVHTCTTSGSLAAGSNQKASSGGGGIAKFCVAAAPSPFPIAGPSEADVCSIPRSFLSEVRRTVVRPQPWHLIGAAYGGSGNGAVICAQRA